MLSFKDNPASLDLAIRTETLDGLRKENAALLEQVDKLKQSRVMEESEDKEETVPRATYDNAVLATQQANEELAQLQKAKMRLAEAFRTKAQEMRESVSALLGVCSSFYLYGTCLMSFGSTAWIYEREAGFG